MPSCRPAGGPLFAIDSYRKYLPVEQGHGPRRRSSDGGSTISHVVSTPYPLDTRPWIIWHLERPVTHMILFKSRGAGPPFSFQILHACTARTVHAHVHHGESDDAVVIPTLNRSPRPQRQTFLVLFRNRYRNLKSRLPEEADTAHQGQHLRAVRDAGAVLHPPGDLYVPDRVRFPGSAQDVSLPRQLLHYW